MDDRTDALVERSRLGTRCTCARLRSAARRVTQLYDQALKGTGLKITQYSILATVLRAGGIAISDLAQRMGLDRTTLTRNLKPLERAGLVRIETGADRRSRMVTVTPAGRALYEATLPRWAEAEDAFRRLFGEEETLALHALLDRVFKETQSAG